MWFSAEQVAKAIDDEPVLPGEMPEEMFQEMKKLDKAGLSHMMRTTCELTKAGIKERLGLNDQKSRRDH